MRIALVADTFPPACISGAVQLRDLAREFARQGHDVTVIVPGHDFVGGSKLTREDGFRVLRVRIRRARGNGALRAVSEAVAPIQMLLHLLFSTVPTRGWEGVVWYSPPIFMAPLVTFLKWRSGCRSYLILRDIFPEWALDLGILRKGVRFWALRLFAKLQCRAADIIGIQTSGNAVYFSGQDAYTAKRLEVLHNWIAQSPKIKCSIDIMSGPLSARKVFVYAGNMGIAQNLDCLMEVAREFKDDSSIGFLFVGRGSEKKRLERFVESCGLSNVHFHDEIPPDEIGALYRQCFAGIVSLAPEHRSHNVPGKFISYMREGLPVLAIVNEGNDLVGMIRGAKVGVVTTNPSVGALKTCVATIARLSPDEILEMRACSAKLADELFTPKRAADQIIAALTGK